MLMRRAFGWDVLECPRCGESMKVLAAITERAVIHKILGALALPADPPQRAPPDLSALPNLEFGFA